MKDPVISIGDGFTYDRESFEGWIAQCTRNGLPITSPKTGLLFHQHGLASLVVPNKTLHALIVDFKEDKTREYRQKGKREYLEGETRTYMMNLDKRSPPRPRATQGV